MRGCLTISLDFELHWGGFEKWPLDARRKTLDLSSKTLDIRNKATHKEQTYYNQYFLNTRRVIPGLLKLFERHKVHVTWATVGMLMHNSRAALLMNAPVDRPTYDAMELSAYNYINRHGIGEDEAADAFHFAPSLVRQILSTPYQELGSHTFSHYYCNEAGQTLDQFRADLQAAQHVAGEYGHSLRSLVFPRNQFNDDYLKVCYEEGFRTVRSNPVDWFWNIDTREETAWKRLNRGLDAYFSLGDKNTYPVEALRAEPGLPISIPASRLLRPHRPKELFLNRLKVKRIVQEMNNAARHGEVYHLWWHPHNFGHYPDQCLEELQVILTHYSQLNKTYGWESLSMGELADRVHPS